MRATSIGLAGDGDDTDLIQAIESSFQVQFGDDTVTWLTVGDLHDALLERLPLSTTAGLCATSMAFYRIRRVLLRTASVQRRVTPATRLADVTSLSPKRLHRELSRTLGIAALPITLSWQGLLGILALVLGLVGGLSAFKFHDLWPALLLVPTGVAMMMTDLGSHGSRTVGDLARVVAVRNFTLFTSDGADSRPSTLWRTLCEIVADETDLDAAQISAETRLIA